jgi:hypothetical protein
VLIQSVEPKDDFWVIRLKVPLNADKAAIERYLKDEYDKLEASQNLVSLNNIFMNFISAGRDVSGTIQGNNDISGTITNTINQVQDSEMKTLLEQLKNTINCSELEEDDKEIALGDTKTITEALTQPNDGKLKKLGKRAIDDIREAFSKLPTINDNVEQLNQLLDQIRNLFQ